MRRAALLALLLAPLFVAPALASPQPTPVCRFCGTQFGDAATEAGVDTTVSRSTVLVRVHENGSATWTVRNRLADGAREFRENPERLDEVARALAGDALLAHDVGGYGLPEDADVTLVAARMEDDTVVLVYRDPDAARRHAGLLVVDYLHDEGYEPWYHVNADRFTVRGPEGSVVTNDPDSGRVDGRSVTWRGDSGGELYEAPDLQGSPYVVFGPEGATGARTTAALALATLPIVVRGVKSFLLPQTLLFAGVLAATALAWRRFDPEVGATPLAGVAAALGVVGLVAPVVTNGVGWLSAPPLFGVAIGLLAFDERARGWLATPRRQALAAAAVLVASFGVLVGVYATLGESHVSPVARAVGTTALALPLVAMLPLGGALEDSPVGWYALAVVAFVAVPVAIVDLADPPAGLAGGVFAFFLVGYAVLAPVVGSVALLLGRSLSRNAY